MMFDKLKKNMGFALAEIIVAVAIFSLIIGLVALFQSDIFSLNRILQVGLQNQAEAKKVVRPFANEVRSAVPSNLGAYPIAEVGTTTFTFYSDIDGDGLRERVRYFRDENDFKKGVIKPGGQPLEYDEDNEEIAEVVHDVMIQDIFFYYDSSYDGTASSTPLEYPIAPSDVRLVKVLLVIDNDPNNPPAPIEITTQVSIRNLKDNL